MEEQQAMEISHINYPLSLVKINNKTTGYVMDVVMGKTLRGILKNPDIPFATKKHYLKEIGRLLLEMQEVRKETPFHNFYMNDIHEKNFMCKEDGTLKAIDVDSFVINDNEVSPSMYLRPSVRLINNPKYNKIADGCMGKQIIPNYDTEIYCYCMIILRFLYGEPIHYLSPDNFLDYLNYLEEIGYDKELINIFKRLYTEKENVNPLDAIDLLIETPYSRCHQYQKARRKL